MHEMQDAAIPCKQVHDKLARWGELVAEVYVRETY